MNLKDNFNEKVVLREYKIGKNTIRVTRKFEKGGTTILQTIMNLLYDEMERRKNDKRLR